MDYVLSNLVLCGIIIAVIAFYFIFVYVCYVEQVIIYKEYVPPTPPQNSYYPLGKITSLSPQQIANRNAIIQKALDAGSS